MDTYKYFAFISYSSRDMEWGKRLQRKLERYKMPATLCSERGWERTPIKPVFFAPTDIQPGVLTEELKERLRASRNLIVICSPNSAQSKWVADEISYFYSIRRADNIYFFIVDGEPNSGNAETECFNPIIKVLGLPEILGANIHERIYRMPWLNRERAYVQLVTKLLNVEFDSIWHRHKRSMILEILEWIVGIAIVVFSLFYMRYMNQPVDVEMKLNEVTTYNENLPPLRDAVVTLYLKNETKVDTITSLDSAGCFKNIPYNMMGDIVRVTMSCYNFRDVDTVLTLKQNMTVDIHRDASIYGDIRFRLYDSTRERIASGIELSVGKYSAVSDENGWVSLSVPLNEQRQFYLIASETELINDTLYMPCSPSDIVKVIINEW